MPVTRSWSGTFLIATPRHATCYRLSQWLGEISGEVLALERSIEITKGRQHPNFRRCTNLENALRAQRDAFNQLFAEIRVFLLLPQELQIPPVLELLTECVAQVAIGLFRHPDDPPWADGASLEGESDDESALAVTHLEGPYCSDGGPFSLPRLDSDDEDSL